MISRRILTLMLNIPLTILILIYLILEELIWERLAEPIYRFFHSLKLLQRIESSVHALNRYVLLLIFLSMFVLVEALGIVSLALFSQGQAVVAIIIYAAKIPIAAFTFWLFRVAQDKLLTFAWFKFCYESLVSFIHYLKASAIYVAIKAKSHALKVKIKQLWPTTTIHRLKAFFGFVPKAQK